MGSLILNSEYESTIGSYKLFCLFLFIEIESSFITKFVTNQF